MNKDEYYRLSRGYWHDVPAITGAKTHIEVLAEAVHQAYLDTCARLGWSVKPENQVPYNELSEDSKELDRASVRAVLEIVQPTLTEAEVASLRWAIDHLTHDGAHRLAPLHMETLRSLYGRG